MNKNWKDEGEAVLPELIEYCRFGRQQEDRVCPVNDFWPPPPPINFVHDEMSKLVFIYYYLGLG